LEFGASLRSDRTLEDVVESPYVGAMAEGPQHEKTLIKVVVFGTAISFGALGVVIASMKGFFHGDASFHFSFASIVGFILGFMVGWLFWKLVFWKRGKNQTARLEG
jgi:hypothetical protein